MLSPFTLITGSRSKLEVVQHSSSSLCSPLSFAVFWDAHRSTSAPRPYEYRRAISLGDFFPCSTRVALSLVLCTAFAKHVMPLFRQEFVTPRHCGCEQQQGASSACGLVMYIGAIKKNKRVVIAPSSRTNASVPSVSSTEKGYKRQTPCYSCLRAG